MTFSPNPPKSIRQSVLERDGRICTYCGKPNLRGRALQIDHVVPMARGGVISMDNLVVACGTCNRRKSKALLKDYIAKRLAGIEKERTTLVSLCRRLEIDLP